MADQANNSEQDKGEKEAAEDAFFSMKTLKGFLKDVAIVVVLYSTITTFGYAAFHIPSSSMEPTLEVGDRVFVAKFPYGYNRYSLFFDPDFVDTERVMEGEPERGDIVVFSLPYLDDTDFIKRVIGLPGDTIELRQGRLYVNTKLVPRQLIREVDYRSHQGYRVSVNEYDETLPNGVTHRIYERSDRMRSDTFGPFKVPADHYFMMGDNRDGSADSRELNRMGPVHKQYLVGRADITSFSFYDCSQGKDVTCPLGIPFGRFFNVLD